MKILRPMKLKGLSFLSLALITSFASGAAAQSLDIAQGPLYQTVTVSPNVMFTLDDSGSMASTAIYAEDSCNYYDFYNPFVNKIFYDPRIRYTPWPSEGSTTWNDASPESGYVVLPDMNSDGELVGDQCTGLDIVYVGNNGSFPKYPNRTDCSGNNCSAAEERQNYGNWERYYNTRLKTARAGIGRAFAAQPERLRVGWTSLWGRNIPGDMQGIKQFDGNHRRDFFDYLYEDSSASGGTPLRRAVYNVGEYFKDNTSDSGPWSTTPGLSGGELHACRQSFHVLMTDGYWNNNVGSSVGNVDSGKGTPFSDVYSNTLADYALEYWENDLLTSVENKVPPPPYADDSGINWQRLVTYGIAFGVTGDVDPQLARSALADRTTSITWGNPGGGSDKPEKIDDLLHAAINTRGDFFSASNPDDFARQLTKVLQDILQRGQDAPAAVGSSTSIQDLISFETEFNSGGWTGNVAAKFVNGNAAWSAVEQAKSKAPSQRKLLTWDRNASGGAQGTLFDTNLSSASKSVIASGDVDSIGDDGPIKLFYPSYDDNQIADEVIRFVRGNQPGDESVPLRRWPEDDGVEYIADIINSQPVLAAVRNEGYRALDGYREFLEDTREENELVLVGSNGGMLHAFDAGEWNDSSDAGSGNEVFGFIPSAVFENLASLLNPEYSHHYFVDATPEVAQAYFDGDWHEIVIGGLGAGGRGVYAIDITDRDNIQPSDVLWELTPDVDPDIGHVFGSPRVARLRDGRFVALIPNGYNNNDEFDSSDDTVKLFVVDIGTGDIIAKIDATEGGHAQANGLSSIQTVRNIDPSDNPTGNDGEAPWVRFVYAGDLRGNLYRFDLWNRDDIDEVENAEAKLVFRAQIPNSGRRQPITTAPAVAAHPRGGFMVAVGTGKLIENDDNVPTDEFNSIYVIRDTNREQPIVRNVNDNENSDFVKRELEAGRRIDGDAATGNLGWYMDLTIDANEKIIMRPRIISGRLVYSSFAGSSSPCDFGGTNYLYVQEAVDGNAFEHNKTQNVEATIGDPKIGAPLAPNIVGNFRAAERGGNEGASNNGGGPGGIAGCSRESFCLIVPEPGEGESGVARLGNAAPSGRFIWTQIE